MFEYFKTRHIGPRDDQYSEMLLKLGMKSLDELIEAVIPKSILDSNVKSKNSFPPISEFDILKRLKENIDDFEYFEETRVEEVKFLNSKFIVKTLN